MIRAAGLTVLAYMKLLDSKDRDRRQKEFSPCAADRDNISCRILYRKPELWQI